MNKLARTAAAMAIALIAVECAAPGTASARGGAASIMDSPGYQRRLQESRGYVTNQSGSLLSTPAAQPVTTPVRKRRHTR